jgi:predicted Rossmann-fold nucleotide-binding protein
VLCNRKGTGVVLSFGICDESLWGLDLTYEETKRAAKALAEMGCDIITGGGPGLMQAANEGAATAPERSRSLRHPRRIAI